MLACVLAISSFSLVTSEKQLPQAKPLQYNSGGYNAGNTGGYNSGNSGGYNAGNSMGGYNNGPYNGPYEVPAASAYSSDLASVYKNAIFAILSKDLDGNLPNKYVCNSVPQNIPYNCYSEYLSSQMLTLVICPSYTTYKCDQCSANLCQNGGTCTTTEANVAQCVCPFGWKGDRCEVLDLCTANPCGTGTATCFKIDRTAGLSTVQNIGQTLCQEICVCEPISPTCNVLKYFYVEGLFTIQSGFTPEPVTAPFWTPFSGPDTSAISSTDANALTCINTFAGTTTKTPSELSAISGVPFNLFKENANVFCPTTKFSVNACDLPRSFDRILPANYNYNYNY